MAQLRQRERHRALGAHQHHVVERDPREAPLRVADGVELGGELLGQPHVHQVGAVRQAAHLRTGAGDDGAREPQRSGDALGLVVPARAVATMTSMPASSAAPTAARQRGVTVSSLVSSVPSRSIASARTFPTA